MADSTSSSAGDAQQSWIVSRVDPGVDQARPVPATVERALEFVDGLDGGRVQTHAARHGREIDRRVAHGSGAALAWPLLPAACALLNEMASFDDAGVSDRTA